MRLGIPQSHVDGSIDRASDLFMVIWLCVQIWPAFYSANGMAGTGHISL